MLIGMYSELLEYQQICQGLFNKAERSVLERRSTISSVLLILLTNPGWKFEVAVQLVIRSGGLLKMVRV